MPIAELQALLASFNPAADIARGLLSAKEFAAHAAQLADLYQRILDAQSNAIAVQQEIASLQAEVARLRSWEADRVRYELKVLGDEVYVYALRGEHHADQPPHYLCPNCFDRHDRSVLQLDDTDYAQVRYYKCPRCSAEYKDRSTYREPPSLSPRRGSPWTR